MFGVLFICTGNICRSPTAEGIFRDIAVKRGFADKVVIDSAGVSGYHVGQSPDERARQTALQNGIDISSLRARLVDRNDFKNFDLILTAERSQADRLNGLRPEGPEYARAKIDTMMSFVPEYGLIDVPDPYYGGKDGFLNVFHILSDMGDSLADCLQKEGKI